ncbi:hypothetical protein AARAC_002702 [Aspergillus arachidicola]|uniref:Uncharacterized protein n=1 Tax=Aspergillus arachidicola TaxID=656916 RepID=A0A2G7EMK2_9EURO|nr:hypothetical protein AARAC_002702 [Aspergillus arachidicola]
MEQPNFQPSFFEKVFIRIFRFINIFVPWHKLPGFLGALNLDFLRIELRAYNLHDGYSSGQAQGNTLDHSLEDERFINARNSDGKFNSLELPLMGCSGMRFGRNFSRQYTQKPNEDQLWTPNPRLVSERFMARKLSGFIPATSLNLLAAAWIQFQIHDWLQHESCPDDFYNKSKEVYDIPLPPDDSWPHGRMILPRTKPDETLDPSDIKCPGYKNINTAWWDDSQIYGSSETVTKELRTKHQDGKLSQVHKGRVAFLPHDSAGNPKTGFPDNWWIGMEMLHTLFALEHNAICDMLRTAYPDWTGDKIFDKARLINCALMAKIHTIEWTPAILAHPALRISMNANWWGLAGEKLTKWSAESRRAVKLSVFVSVYRMYPLIPDSLAFFGAEDGKHKSTIPFPDASFNKAQGPFDLGISFADSFYSFGINYPGAITNNYYPGFMRDLSTPDGQLRDLGTVDVLRDRERGVPRYNQFRRLLRMSVPKTFEELTGGNKELAGELREVYGDIELVDTLVGSHSEPLPKGFGFSETAFRIFILMATRRLKSDRFIAGQWNAETYTKEGFRWLQNNGMKDVLMRHFPELEVHLKNSKNVFAAWEKLTESEKYKGVETNALGI